jgi:hypothetical protein
MNKNMSVKLGWLNVVVSRLDQHRTQAALGLPDLTVGERWCCIPSFGRALVHPADLPDHFLAVLCGMDETKVRGVVLGTKDELLVGLVWLQHYVKAALTNDPRLTTKRGKLLRRYLLGLHPGVTPKRVVQFWRWLKVWYVDLAGQVKDISSLDPGSEDEDVATWGHLGLDTGGDLVAFCVNQYCLA